MRRTQIFGTLALVGLLAPGTAAAQDADRKVADGGIKVEGWSGAVDARAAGEGATVNDARFAAEGDGFRITTGPATTYWSSERLTGDYTVRATFHEAEYMALNDHPHPYGIMIGGNDLGSANQSLLYCAAYGNGNYIVRGFGPEPFQLGGRRPTPHTAVNRAAGKGQPVTQEIAVSVRGDNVSCEINGTVVATFPKADLVGAGKLASTDGNFGLRLAHNVEVVVTGLRVVK